MDFVQSRGKIFGSPSNLFLSPCKDHPVLWCENQFTAKNNLKLLLLTFHHIEGHLIFSSNHELNLLNILFFMKLGECCLELIFGFLQQVLVILDPSHVNEPVITLHLYKQVGFSLKARLFLEVFDLAYGLILGD